MKDADVSCRQVQIQIVWVSFCFNLTLTPYGHAVNHSLPMISLNYIKPSANYGLNQLALLPPIYFNLQPSSRSNISLSIPQPLALCNIAFWCACLLNIFCRCFMANWPEISPEGVKVRLKQKDTQNVLKLYFSAWHISVFHYSVHSKFCMVEK